LTENLSAKCNLNQRADKPHTCGKLPSYEMTVTDCIIVQAFRLNMTPNNLILAISIPLALLVSLVSLVGWLTPDFYFQETPNWQVQSRGQDLIDLLLIMPTLLVTSILAYRNNKIATAIWGGVVFYLTYTFFLYCFDVHFNKLFILYCFCLGLSFYGLLYFLFSQQSTDNPVPTSRFIIRFIGTYFVLLSSLFYLLWLSEIIPANLENIIPKSVSETGLFTNGVHVLDLAIVLPAIFITGVLLLRNSSIGFTLAPVFLTFFILMDLTIGTLAFLMTQNGIQDSLGLSFTMGTLALLSTTLLIVYFKNI
jgi:hypothetical protein